MDTRREDETWTAVSSHFLPRTEDWWAGGEEAATIWGCLSGGNNMSPGVRGTFIGSMDFRRVLIHINGGRTKFDSFIETTIA